MPARQPRRRYRWPSDRQSWTALAAFALYPAVFVLNVVVGGVPDPAFDWVRLLINDRLLALAHAGVGGLLAAFAPRWWAPLVALGCSPLTLEPTYYALVVLGVGSLGD